MVITPNVYCDTTQEALDLAEKYIYGKDVIAIRIYANPYDAAMDGYYMPGETYGHDNAVKCVAIPTMVIKTKEGNEFLLRRVSCGHLNGESDAAAYILRRIGIPEEYIQCVYFASFVALYLTEGAWSPDIRGMVSQYNMQPQMVTYGQELAVLFETDLRGQRKHGIIESLLRIQKYSKNITNVTVYSRRMAIKTGRRICTINTTSIYRIILKNKNGVEFWLKVSGWDMVLLWSNFFVKKLFQKAGMEIRQASYPAVKQHNRGTRNYIVSH